MLAITTPEQLQNFLLQVMREYRASQRSRQGLNHRTDANAAALSARLDADAYEAMLWAARIFAAGSYVSVDAARDANLRILGADVIPQEETNHGSV